MADLSFKEKVELLENDPFFKRIIKAMIVGYLDYRRLNLEGEDVHDQDSLAQINLEFLVDDQKRFDKGIGREGWASLKEREVFNKYLDEAMELEKRKMRNGDREEEFYGFSEYLAGISVDIIADHCDKMRVERILELIKLYETEGRDNCEVREKFAKYFLCRFLKELNERLEAGKIGRKIYPYTIV